jgi:quercetin dioxygenase-like cupin family protein
MMYAQGHYQDVNRFKVEKEVRKEGFDPLLIADPPGATYPPHSHPETKLLAFLRGRMEVMMDGKCFDCSPGDRVIIPGNTVHSAVAGPEGCDFFWSEKIL